MYERLDQCPICKSGDYKNFLICNDHSVTQESFAIVSCKKCEFKFTNPRPAAENLEHYYQSDAYISHTNKGTNLINSVYKIVRHFTIKKKVKFINQYHSRGNLLDYGCGTGAFIEKAKEGAWNVSGVEPSENARKEISDKVSSLVHESINDIKLKKHFHIITLWHVLEHVYDLGETLKKIKKLLHPQGKLIIAVPNCDSYDAQYYKAYWAAYDVPRHLYHFTPKTIKTLLANHKMILEDIYPMPLDAFYVSMLSEKYKTGTNHFYNALKVGLQSNQWAKQNSNNYSSLIFVASLA